MANSDNQYVNVFQNGEWNKYESIGNYKVLYGPMGIEYLEYKMPDNVNSDEDWKLLNSSLTCADILPHLWRISFDLSKEEIRETYGENFQNNLKKYDNDLESIDGYIADVFGNFRDENILMVEPGDRINYDMEFEWSANNEWARRDPDFVVLFCENWQNKPTIFIHSEIYSKLTELIMMTWLKLTSN